MLRVIHVLDDLAIGCIAGDAVFRSVESFDPAEARFGDRVNDRTAVGESTGMVCKNADVLVLDQLRDIGEKAVSTRLDDL